MSGNQRILLASLACMALVAGLVHLSGPSAPAASGPAASGPAASGPAVSGPAVSTADGAIPTAAHRPVPPPSVLSPDTVPPSSPADPDPSAAPPTTAQVAATAVAPAADPHCPTTAHGAVVDRKRQRGWLCDHGSSTGEFPITTAKSQPVPGTYPVYAKDLKASSNFGGHYSTMTHFVAFTTGPRTGARVAFHSVPKLANGKYVQTFDSVGTLGAHGESSGCIRVLPDQAVIIWNWLTQGDEVVVIN